MKKNIEEKNILIIGSGMKPFENANGICTEALMKALKEKQKKVYYLDWLADEEKIIKREENIYVCEKNVEKITKNSIKEKIIFLNLKKLLFSLYGRILYPFHSVKRTLFLCKMADKICKEYNIKIVISIYQPFVTLFSGYYAKKRNKSILFIPYYLDLISNPYISFTFNSVKRQKSIMKRWEDRINKKAEFPIYMIASKNFHDNINFKKSWYTKIKYLDIPLYNPDKQNSKKKYNTSDDIELVFSGYIGDHRNIEFFLKIITLLPNNIKLTLIGNITAKQKNIIEKFIKYNPQKIKYIGYIEHKELLDLLERADCLVNFGVISQTAISAKIYEYISFGKPIIMTYSIDDEPSVRVLKKYPLSFIIDERKRIDNDLINKISDFLKATKNKVINPKILEKEFTLNKAETFVSLIDNVCQKNNF